MARGRPLALCLLAALVAGGMTLGHGRARADEPAEDRAEARRQFEQAEAHFKQGQYAEALVGYEAGYRAAPLPGFLIDIAHCHRMMGELRKARAHYRKFLLVAPQSPRRQEVENLVAELDRAIGAEPGATPEGTAGASPEPAAPSSGTRPANTRWWLWTALASSVVGGTVANLSAPRAVK